MSLTATELETIVESSATERQTYTDPDGWIVDAATGEVLGRADVAQRFEVTSDDAADFVLQIKSEIEGAIAGLTARKTALVAMLDAQIADQRRRLSWWDWRFAASLTAFARSCLTGKARTAKFAWGQVSFRKTAGSTVILDDAAALAFVEAWAPEKVKVVRSVNVSAVKAAIEACQAACPGEEIEVPFLRVSGEDETVNITTGIEQPEKGKR